MLPLMVCLSGHARILPDPVWVEINYQAISKIYLHNFLITIMFAYCDFIIVDAHSIPL